MEKEIEKNIQQLKDQIDIEELLTRNYCKEITQLVKEINRPDKNISSTCRFVRYEKLTKKD